MPEMTGLELQRRLAALGCCPPTIFVTAYDTPQTRDQIRQSGCSELLLKPFDQDLLLSAIAGALQRSSPAVAMPPVAR